MVFHSSLEQIWKFRISSLFREKGLLEHINNPPPDVKPANFDQNDCKAMNLLIKHIGNSHTEYITEKLTAYEMIQTLDAVFNRKTVGTTNFLKRKLMSLKCKEGRSLEGFFNKFEAAVRSYKTAGAACDDIEIIVNLLMAMPDSYGHVVNALETLDEKDLTIERVKSRLLEAELKLLSKAIELESEAPVAFQSQQKKPQYTCFKCGKIVHKANKCRSKAKSRKFQSNAASSSKTSSGTSFACYDHFMSQFECSYGREIR